jgi:hypothetical protein
MNVRISKEDRPWWVKTALWQIQARKFAITFMIVVFGIACVSMIAGIVIHPVFYGGALLFLIATWYWFAIRWVDHNGGWE